MCQILTRNWLDKKGWGKKGTEEIRAWRALAGDKSSASETPLPRTEGATSQAPAQHAGRVGISATVRKDRGTHTQPETLRFPSQPLDPPPVKAAP